MSSYIEKLMTDLKSDDWTIREGAVDRLGEINDYISVAPLIVALSDRDSDIQEKANKFLKKITAQDFGLDAAKWQEWWENNRTTLSVREETIEKNEAKKLYKQIWSYHERGEKNKLLEALLFLIKSFPDSEEAQLAFKSFSSINYFNIEEQKSLHKLFNKYKTEDNIIIKPPKNGNLKSEVNLKSISQTRMGNEQFNLLRLLFSGLMSSILTALFIGGGWALLYSIFYSERIQDVSINLLDPAIVLARVGLVFGAPIGFFKYSFRSTAFKHGITEFSIGKMISNPQTYAYIWVAILMSIGWSLAVYIINRVVIGGAFDYRVALALGAISIVIGWSAASYGISKK